MQIVPLRPEGGRPGTSRWTPRPHPRSSPRHRSVDALRRISPSAVLMRRPLSGTPWSTGPISSDRATVALRGLPLEPSPSTADDAHLLTGFYL